MTTRLKTLGTIALIIIGIVGLNYLLKALVDAHLLSVQQWTWIAALAYGGNFVANVISARKAGRQGDWMTRIGYPAYTGIGFLAFLFAALTM
ncbi:hypothetical protein MF271_05035 [Deinococcus sp. KNUC1210]|uniref:hypothetical protein n=1 Tax=Deinococcus sp. KNUC1210 TaxID=2917691 RepID=UPI001EF0600C|nr:hypothetical protein [Deinococcus sp. KNUC1210]ULH16000.1 hypothetical protein MF271_05035 [Deinococcus sp. KNUC1210]